MKKRIWILSLCLASFMAANPVMANPSIVDVANETVVAVIDTLSDYTDISLEDEKDILVVASKEETFADYPEIQQVVKDLLDKDHVFTTVELLERAGVKLYDSDGRQKEYFTTKGNPIDPTKLDPITHISNFEYEDGTMLDNGPIEATLPGCEAVQQEKIERVILVQFDLEQYERLYAGEEVELKPYFIECDVLLEDGTITAQFPCTGPFFIVINTDVSEERQ